MPFHLLADVLDVGADAHADLGGDVDIVSRQSAVRGTVVEGVVGAFGADLQSFGGGSGGGAEEGEGDDGVEQAGHGDRSVSGVQAHERRILPSRRRGAGSRTCRKVWRSVGAARQHAEGTVVEPGARVREDLAFGGDGQGVAASVANAPSLGFDHQRHAAGSRPGTGRVRLARRLLVGSAHGKRLQPVHEDEEAEPYHVDEVPVPGDALEGEVLPSA